MEPITYITGAISIAAVSGAVGKALGGRSKVKEDTCKERRAACFKLLVEKIDNLTDLVKNGGKAN